MKKDCIILTTPKAFWDAYPGGRDRFYEVMTYVDNGTLVWWQTCASIPVQPVEFCYLIVDGAVKLRLTIQEFKRNTSKEFEDSGVIRVFEHRNWAVLCGPVVHAPKIIPMRGFQGFRYTEFLF